jgi:putative endonuclease
LKASLTRTALGRRAELAVADFLFANGFTLLARNLKLGPLELDVVARKGALVVIVEVRTRGPGAWVRAFESVTWAKQRRILRAVERLWRTRLARYATIQRVRVDVAAVTFAGGRTSIEYVAGAVG